MSRKKATLAAQYHRYTSHAGHGSSSIMSDRFVDFLAIDTIIPSKTKLLYVSNYLQENPLIFSPLFFLLLEFGVSFVVLNYICLSFMQIHAIFYFNYINYSGLLIFCCQNVATIGLTVDFDVKLNLLCSY